MPKLWNDTIEAHRRDVRDAVIDATAALVSVNGLLSVTMSQVAEAAGIGRATLYKYFPDVESIVVAWHEREIAAHLAHLSRVRDEARDPFGRLQAVLEAYAMIDHEHHGSDDHRRHLNDHALDDALHRGRHVVRARGELTAMIGDLIADCVTAGGVRDDVAPAELASYCVHALAGASALPSKAAVRRLVEVALGGLRPAAK